MMDYMRLIESEEKFRLTEQSALINSLLEGGANKGKLSILRRAGLAMTGLEVVGNRSGFGGRLIIELKWTFSTNTSINEMERSGKRPCCFKPGDLVKLIISGKLLECTGTIEKCPRDIDVSVSLHSEDSNELETILTNKSKISIVKIVDEVGMFKKMKENLERFKDQSDQKDLLNYMKKVIENGEEIENEAKLSDLKDFNSGCNSKLNLEQEIGLKKCLKMIFEGQNSIVLIHGPPGTGKTSVLVELINNLKRGTRGSIRILVCGPSNLSVDNILERIKDDGGPEILRIGHPSRVLESCQGKTLDFWCENSDAGLLLKDVQGEIDSILKVQLPRGKSREERRQLYNELRELRRERRERERKLQIDLIDGAEMVFCTLGTACGKKLRNSKRKFDLAIVDEAGQALFPEILIAPLLADKLILAGDHFQLPPTVMNPAVKDQLQVSLFEHFIQKGLTDSVMLKEQYRMNELIMKWSNEKFYKNQLRAADSVAQWKLSIDNCHDDGGFGDVLIFYDTCGFDLWESASGSDGFKGILIEESSKFNQGEAKIVLDHFKSLINLGISSDSIAIISPYSAQVSLIRDLVDDQIHQDPPEINSIDAFQGREKDIVILSLVRSNPDGIVGFLAEMRRINVAMTRAKKQLVIVGDSETLSRDNDLKQLMEFLNENAVIKFPNDS